MGQASVIRLGQQLPSQELNLGAVSAVEKVFRKNDGSALVLPFPLGSLAGPTGKTMSLFRIRAAGRVFGSGALNWTPQLLWGTSTTVANNTDLESGAAGALTSQDGTWRIDGDYSIDFTTGRISGFASVFISGNAQVLTATAVSDLQIGNVSVPPLVFNRPENQYGFVVSGTFSVGNAANKAFLDIFQLEMVA